MERERRITIKFGNASGETLCFACEASARFVTVDEAAAICETTAREIFRWVESGQLHFQETVRGRLLICLVSLLKLPNENQKFLIENHE